MRQFIKFFLAAFLAVFAGLFFIFMVAGVALTSSGQEKKVKVKDNSILTIDFPKPIPELTNNVKEESTALFAPEQLGVSDIVFTLQQAAQDPKIKGIYLGVNNLQSGFATTRVVREALSEFKESGKFIVAYAKSYSQNAYYLASVADQVYLNPLGYIDLKGFAAKIMYFKEMFDNIGLDMQVTYVGDFKSATEPFRRTNMSDANRKQVRAFLDDYYDLFLTDLSAARGISKNEVRLAVDSLAGGTPEMALEAKLIDGITYNDQVQTKLRSLLEIEEDAKINQVNLLNYYKTLKKPDLKSAKNKIAVVNAEGTINTSDENGAVGDRRFVRILQQIRNDEDVKAVVLRVNSPGGDALASENIWREVELMKESGRKVVVSMGNYAASGGYYISCNADSIIAEPNTLTGSIGVFMMLPSINKMLTEKLNIYLDTVKTGAFSGGFSPLYDLTPAEKNRLTYRTESLYQTFLQRVADGRGMTKAQVHAIAQGRVWTGRKAVEIGLVDKLGGLDDAIQMAADMEDLPTYMVDNYPKIGNKWEKLISELTGIEDEDKGVIRKAMMQHELGNLYPYYSYIKEMLQADQMQMRLPYIIEF